MKPQVHAVAALVAATTVNVIAGSPPTAHAPFSPQVTTQAAPTIRVGVDLVRIDATVTDERGRHVPDLGIRDFEVLQDGRRQTISTLAYVPADDLSPFTSGGTTPPGVVRSPSANEVRRTIAIVVDDLGLSFESTYRVREMLQKFVDREVRPGDLVAILRTGAGMGTLQQFTIDRRMLRAAVEHVRWNMMARVPAFQGEAVDAFRNEVFTAGTLGAIQYIVRGVSELPGRKSVIVLSDGFRLTDADRRHGRVWESLRSLVDSANRAGVVIYTIDARGLVTAGPAAEDSSPGSSTARLVDLRATEDGLDVLAGDTGGLFLHNANDLEGALRRALEDQRGYYLIGYVPDRATFSGPTPRFHSLRVRVTRPELRVRSRRGFLGRPDEAQQPPTAANRMMSAVTSPFVAGDIRLRLSSLFAQIEKVGPVVQSYMHLDARDLQFADEADGTRSAKIEVLAVTFGDNGVVADQKGQRYTVSLSPDRYAKALQNGFIYTFRVPVKRSGPYQLRIALRDVNSDRLGSATQFIEVPDLKKGRLTLSSVIVEGTAYAQPAVASDAAEDGVEDVDPLASITLRTFRQGTEVSYGCYIYNARVGSSRQPQLESEVRLYRDGTEVLRSGPRPVDTPTDTAQQLFAGGVLKLGQAMTPGTYVLEIEVTDRLAKEHPRATQTVDFDVSEGVPVPPYQQR
jgi:VWFA-related protein